MVDTHLYFVPLAISLLLWVIAFNLSVKEFVREYSFLNMRFGGFALENPSAADSLRLPLYTSICNKNSRKQLTR